VRQRRQGAPGQSHEYFRLARGKKKLAVGARKKNDDDACKPVGARYTRPPLLLLLLLLWSK